MNKTTTYSKSAENIKFDSINEKEIQLMNPSDESVQKVLQYAAIYRAEMISKNDCVEYYLN